MAKQIPVLGLEADCVRAVRLAESGKDFAIDIAEAWSLAPEGLDDGATIDADAGGGQGKPALPDGTAGRGSLVASNDGEDVGATSADSASDGSVDSLVAAFNAAAKRFGTREFALSLPLSRFLAKGVRVPVDARDTLPEVAQTALDEISPFPDEPLTAGFEIVAETDDAAVAVAAALPEASSPDVADALAEAKIRIVRVDVAALGWLRSMWPRITAVDLAGSANGQDFTSSEGSDSVPVPDVSSARRRLVLFYTVDGWDLIALDDGAPTILRGLGEMGSAAELGREVMLSLLHGPAGGEVGDVVVFSEDEVPQEFMDRLGAFGPVRFERIEDQFAGLEGCARRALEGTALDATPASWAEIRNEARFKKRLIIASGIAAAIWLMVMGVLFGVPFVYDQMRDSEKAKIARHAKAYKAVKDMRDKVKLVQRYSDHARGALEMFKAVADRMPDGITLTAFQYKRGANLHVTGEAEQPTDVYTFKERFDQIMVDEEPVFAEVRMPGVSGRGGKNKFDIDATFVSEEDK